MKDRIKKIRQKTGLNQEDFGRRIGIGKTSVSKLENGENNPSEQTIMLICQEFSINENWLRTGHGEMFRPIDRKEEIAKLASDLFKGEKDSFKERLILALANLDGSEWELLEKIAIKIAKEKD